MSVSAMPLINLLPWREARQLRRRQLFCMTLGASVMLTMAVVAGAIMLLTSILTEHEQANVDVREHIGSLQQRANEQESVIAEYQRQQADFTRTRQLHAARMTQTRMLAALLMMMSDDLTLTDLHYEPPAVQIRGSAESAHHVSGWMNLLEERTDTARAELQALYLDQQSAPAMRQSYLFQIRLELSTVDLAFAAPEAGT